VASTTLREPLEWQNSTLLQGDAAEGVAALKQEDGDDLHVIGSTKLVQALIEHDLVDEFRVMIDPVLLGGGKRLFSDDGALRPLRLLDSQVTTTGAILASYAPAGTDRQPEPTRWQPRTSTSASTRRDERVIERRVARTPAALAKRGWRKRPASRAPAPATSVSTGDQRRSA
jgi:hypothetical protein